MTPGQKQLQRTLGARSTAVTFVPHTLRGGHYRFDVEAIRGSAGSVREESTSWTVEGMCSTNHATLERVVFCCYSESDAAIYRKAWRR